MTTSEDFIVNPPRDPNLKGCVEIPVSDEFREARYTSPHPTDPASAPVRSLILRQAEETINGPRRDEYGDAAESFERIAGLWSLILGMEVTAEQVALCMVQVKLGRLIHSPNHADSWVDICGYAALGGEIAAKPGRYL